MLRDRVERWVPTVAVLLVAAMLGWEAIEGAGPSPAAAVGLAVLLALGWWLSPLRRGRHVPHDRAQAASSDDDVIVYWKPGCMYCTRLLAGLRRSERNHIRWVNVWKDQAAAQFVADHNHGDVLTPTVITGAGHRLPMTVEAVRSHLDNSEAS